MKISLFLIAVLFYLAPIAQETGSVRKLGYGFSPRGFIEDYSEIASFLTEVGETCDGGVVFGNGAWRDSYETGGVIPGIKFICENRETYGYTDMLAFGWATYPELYLDNPEDLTNNWTNESTKDLFLEMLIHAADSLKPTYLFIGNEINNYWEQDSMDYLNMVEFYYEAYDSIKAYSPTTQVGTIFNYESMAGRGELTGWTTPYWNALEVFDQDKVDIIGLTVYPFFDHVSSSEIPADYLSDFFSRVGDKPVAITETGWPAESFIGSWDCSEEEQVQYMNRFFELIEDRNVPVVNWLFLHYLITDIESDAYAIFKSVSLRDSLHNDRPALETWLSHCSFAGMEENDRSSLSIYPNPTTGVVTIAGITIEKVTLYTIQGQEVMTIENGLNQQISLDLNGLHSGIYLVDIIESDGIKRTERIHLKRP